MKLKNILQTVIFSVCLLALSVFCITKPETAYSESERRALLSFPSFTTETVLSGEFMSEFETYAQDQFPLRDSFRSLKAFFSLQVLNQKVYNELFMADGHISKLDAEESEYMLNYSADLFKKVYDKYLADAGADVYFSIVPDKNCFIANKNGYPSLDYEGFIERMKDKTSFMEYIDITDLLSEEDYYKTDSHWKQECITDIAARLAEKMGTDVSAKYTVNTLDKPFYGVYASQLNLPVKADEIKYLTNDILKNATVTYYGNSGQAQKGEMYDMKKAYGKDPYEMFLSGSMPVVVIDNPEAKEEKELVILRDSFSSSLAPLLVPGYSKITVLDLRYINSDFVGSFCDFTNADVLFIYSASLLNSGTAMK